MSHYLSVYTHKNISVVLVHRRLCRHLLGRRESKWPILYWSESVISLWEEERGGTVAWQWRHNGCDGVSNLQPHHCLLNRLFGRRSKKTAKLRVTGLCSGKSPVTGEIPAQMASNAENVSIWWRHREYSWSSCVYFVVVISSLHHFWGIRFINLPIFCRVTSLKPVRYEKVQV